jgi:threonyl-tRNA synthetase
MIHKALLGSLERFISVYIEHTAGNFPLWLSPVQAVVIPVRDTHNPKAGHIYRSLKNAGVRVKLLDEDENLGKKVRYAKNMKIPYTIIIGDKDIEAGKITLESRDHGQIGQLSVEEVTERLATELRDRA